jgi:Leucine-rich repeat (LRR) protein
LHDLSPLAGLATLEELDVDGPNGVRTLEAIAPLVGLKKLSVFGGVGVKDPAAVAAFDALKELSLRLVPGAKLPPLASLAELDYVHLEHGGIVDVAALESATSITPTHTSP